MNKKDELTVKRIISDSVQGILSINQIKSQSDYLLNNELPIIYQFNEDILNDTKVHNFLYINNYIEALRDPSRSVMDLERRYSYDTAANYITYTMFRVFGENLKWESIPNLCIVPVPTSPSEPAYYAEWGEVLQRVERRTGVRACMDAYFYCSVRDSHRHRETEGLPLGFIDTIALVNEDSEYANVVLVIDRMYKGMEMLQMKQQLEEFGHNVILGICLSQVVL